MKLLRFAFLGLCVVGTAACGYATARVLGWVPVGHLAPYPAWAASHFAAATLFSAIAPLQFWARLRAHRPRLHRLVGRTGVAIGIVMALSGLAIVYDAPDRTIAELIFMTVFALAYLAFLGLGLKAALARDIRGHRAWMTRMTATALTPVTQRLLFPPLAALIGIDGMATFWQLFVSAAWMAWGLNMAVAEGWLRGPRPAPRPATGSASPA